jgi:hypothetical protein
MIAKEISKFFYYCVPEGVDPIFTSKQIKKFGIEGYGGITGSLGAEFYIAVACLIFDVSHIFPGNFEN